MLFSEPKIPQWKWVGWIGTTSQSFSALQRAENSSMLDQRAEIEQFIGFSALQRAENSSIKRATAPAFPDRQFQCSSASRKFLNFSCSFHKKPLALVSVLFSEPKIPQSHRNRLRLFIDKVSVLFSEPKIPQWCTSACCRRFLNVSVLFSEPKIPQS